MPHFILLGLKIMNIRIGRRVLQSKSGDQPPPRINQLVVPPIHIIRHLTTAVPLIMDKIILSLLFGIPVKSHDKMEKVTSKRSFPFGKINE